MSAAPESGAPSPSLSAVERSGRLALQYGVVIATVLLFIVLSTSSDAFLTSRNLLNILEQNAPVGIAAIATTPLLLARGIDLSIGAVYGLAGIVAAEATNAIDPVSGLIIGVVAGLVLGTINGLICTLLGVNALITTLASGIVMGGLGLLITDGFAVTVSDPGFAKLGNEKLLGVAIPAWLFVGFAVAGQLLMSKTTMGRKVYSSGGNPEAARLAGIRVNRVLTTTFALSGLGAAVGGLIVASRVSQGSPDIGGTAVLFTALTAVVVGGTSIHGGEGAIWRTVVGVFLLALINNGLNLLGVAPIYTGIVEGVVILIAVAIDAQGRRARH